MLDRGVPRSLYAQELKTLGPISAARLQARAAEIEAWISR